MSSKLPEKEIQSIAKQILESSLEDIMDIFGPDIQYVDPVVQSQLSQLVDRTDKVGEWVTFSVLNMNAIEEERARGGEYMIWETAEDELVCPFCGPVNHKMVSVSDLLSLGIPPAHTNCRCRLMTIEERYGELKPVVYYYQLPYEYEEWRNSGKPDYTLSESERVWLFVQRTLELNKHVVHKHTPGGQEHDQQAHAGDGAAAPEKPKLRELAPGRFYSSDKVPPERVERIAIAFTNQPDKVRDTVGKIELHDTEGSMRKAGEVEFREAGHWSEKERTMRFWNMDEKDVDEKWLFERAIPHESSHAVWSDINKKFDTERDRYNTESSAAYHDMKEKGYPEFGRPSYMVERGSTEFGFNPDTFKEDPKYGDRSINDYEAYVLLPQHEKTMEKLGRMNMHNFHNATNEEGGVTEYSRNWLKEGSVGYNENLAEFTTLTLRTPRQTETRFPKTYKYWFELMKPYGWTEGMPEPTFVGYPKRKPK